MNEHVVVNAITTVNRIVRLQHLVAYYSYDKNEKLERKTRTRAHTSAKANNHLKFTYYLNA